MLSNVKTEVGRAKDSKKTDYSIVEVGPKGIFRDLQGPIDSRGHGEQRAEGLRRPSRDDRRSGAICRWNLRGEKWSGWLSIEEKANKDQAKKLRGEPARKF